MYWVKRRISRRACLGAVVVALVAGALAAARVELKAQPAPGEADAVLATDTELGNAMRGADKSAARKLLSLEFTYTDQDGAVHGRKEFLTGLKGFAPADAIDVNVKVYGLVAMVTGKRKSAQDSEVFFVDVWVKEKRAWRTLVMQDVVLAGDGAVPPSPADIAKLVGRDGCKNPCETIPYRVRSPAEQDIFNSFQAIAKATIARDGAEYGKHLADEFVHYRTGSPPVAKSERIDQLGEEKAHEFPAILTPVQSMHLWVFGDGAAMISANGVPGAAEPVLRTARIWVKRNGQWLMAISVQTDVKE